MVHYNFTLFRVTKTLEVIIEKVKNLSAAEKSKINNKFNSAAAPRTPTTKNKKKVETDADGPPAADELQVADVVAVVEGSEDLTRGSKENIRGVRNTTKQEWLSKLNSSFVDSVVAGMEASMRTLVMKKIAEKEQLKGKENQAVINSINHYIFEYIGAQRPEKVLCR